MSGKYIGGIGLMILGFLASTCGSEMMLQEDVKNEVAEQLGNNEEDDDDED